MGNGDGAENPVMQVLTEMGGKTHTHFESEAVKLFEAAGAPGEADAAGELGTYEMVTVGSAAESLGKLVEEEIKRRFENQAEEPDISVKEALMTLKSTGWTGFGGMDTYDERSQQIMLSLAGLGFESRFGRDLGDVGLMWAAQENYSGTESAMPEGGWSQITDFMMNGVDVKLDSKVTAVRAGGDGVEVELASGDKLSAHACICTLPIGVLKAGVVAFEPPLPAPKTDAIAKTMVGSVNRIAVRFDKCFWSEDSTLFTRVITDAKRRDAACKEWTTIFNWHSYKDSNVLVAVATGAAADVSEGMSDQEVGQWFKVLLASMFDKRAVETAKVKEVLVSRWTGDEFSLGATSCQPVGYGLDQCAALAAPHGAIFFAGEATHAEKSGSVAGAFISGERAANEALAYAAAKA